MTTSSQSQRDQWLANNVTQEEAPRMAASIRTRKDIIHRAGLLGLFVTTWSPGDGATRYRFSRKDEDYFALGGNNSFTALGVKEADAMLDAYGYGRKEAADDEDDGYRFDPVTGESRLYKEK